MSDIGHFCFLSNSSSSRLSSLSSSCDVRRPGKYVHHHFACRSLEHSLQQVRRHLALGFISRLASLVYVGALFFIADNDAFVRHDLSAVLSTVV